MDLLIRNGTIVTSQGAYPADLAVTAGKIEAIGKVIKPDFNTQVVEARGLYVLPGAIDAHVHLALPVGDTSSSDDYFTGTRAAACGGTTTVIDFIQQDMGEMLPDTLDRRDALASPECCVDYAFHIGISDVSAPGALSSMAQVIARGVTSFKAYMVYDFGVDDGALFEILEEAAQLGALVGVHAENRAMIHVLTRRFLKEGKTDPWWHYKSRDELVEGEAVERAISLARMANAPIYIAHLSSAQGVTAVARAREAGQPVFAETCPQYLHFTNTVYRGARAREFVCSPPIKGRASQEALWRALDSGVIDIVATDHCPFTRSEKDRGEPPGNFTVIPNGLGGVEIMYAYMLSCALRGNITLSQAIRLCCENPARLFGIAHRKGTLNIGMDADIVLFDPRARATIQQHLLHGACDHTVWEGAALRGRVVATYSRGRLVFRNGQFLGERGAGVRLKCRPLRFSSPRL